MRSDTDLWSLGEVLGELVLNKISRKGDSNSTILGSLVRLFANDETVQRAAATLGVMEMAYLYSKVFDNSRNARIGSRCAQSFHISWRQSG